MMMVIKTVMTLFNSVARFRPTAVEDNGFLNAAFLECNKKSNKEN